MWAVGCGRGSLDPDKWLFGGQMNASAQKLCRRSAEQTEILSARIACGGAGGDPRPLVGPKRRPLKIQAGVNGWVSLSEYECESVISEWGAVCSVCPVLLHSAVMHQNI